jgi:hypothetical protein
MRQLSLYLNHWSISVKEQITFIVTISKPLGSVRGSNQGACRFQKCIYVYIDRQCDDPSSFLQIKTLFKVNWCVCANKRPTSDGESKVFKRSLVPQAKTKKEGKQCQKVVKMV